MQRKIYTDFQRAVAWGGAGGWLQLFVCVEFCGVASVCWLRPTPSRSRVGNGLFLAGYTHEEGFTVVTYLNPSF